MLARIKRVHDYAKNNGRKIYVLDLFKIALLKQKWEIGAKDYFENGLYKREKLHAYLLCRPAYYRNWNNIKEFYFKDKGKLWRILRFVEFNFFRIIYPGIDAMDYACYEFYNKRHRIRKTFITEGFLNKLDKVFNSSSEEIEILRNKSLFNSYFHENTRRKWITSYEMNKETLLSLFKEENRVIVKPIDGSQGRRVFLADMDHIDDWYDLVKRGNYIIEEVISQCDRISSLNSSSINSLRVYTLKKENNYVIPAAVIRIGRANSITDNYSTGGIAANINVETGIVDSIAVSEKMKDF